MKISSFSVTKLANTLCGDTQIAPYMSGPQLVKFLNELGFRDVYPQGGGFPSRWMYTEDKLKALNGKAALKTCLQNFLDPRRFMDTAHTPQEVVSYLNELLSFDGYEVVQQGKGYTVKEVGAREVEFTMPFEASTPALETFIEQQVEKCSRKLDEGDYDGAITNARSFTESVLIDLETKLAGERAKNSSDLPKLFKRVRSLMNMDEGEYKDLTDVQQLIRGLVSTVNGLAGMSNAMGDRHAQKIPPAKHHAILCVNSAKTVCEFMVSSYVHQQAKERPS